MGSNELKPLLIPENNCNNFLFFNNKLTYKNSIDLKEYEKLPENLILNFSLINCDINSIYSIKIYTLNSDLVEELIGSSEEIQYKMLNEKNEINFIKNFELHYFYYKKQKIIIKIQKDNNIYSYETYLHFICKENNPLKKIIKPINKKLKENLIISHHNIFREIIIEFQINSKEKINFQKISNKFFFMIYNGDIFLYRSEIISDNGIFKPFQITEEYLIPKFSIIFYDTTKKEIYKINSNIDKLIDIKFNDEIVIVIPINKKLTISMSNKSRLLNYKPLKINRFFPNENAILTIKKELFLNDFSLKNESNIFYDKNNNFLNHERDNKREKILLNFSITNAIKNINYILEITTFDFNKGYDITIVKYQMNSLNFLNFNFPNLIILDYYPDFTQEINIKVNYGNKNNNQNVEFNTTLQNICNNNDLSKTFYINQEIKHSVVIKCKKINKEEIDSVQINLIVNEDELNDFDHIENIFYFRILTNDKKIIYRSEILSNLNLFSEIILPFCILFPNITIVFYNYLFEAFHEENLTLNDLLSNKKIEIKLSEYKKFTLNILSKKIHPFTFLEYFSNNFDFNLNLAIDFTGSNGNIMSENSLHSLVTKTGNEYEISTKICAEILSFYDKHKNFPVYGFGGIFPKISLNTQEIFNLNLKQNPIINGIENVLETYHLNINKIEFGGASLLAPVLNHVVNYIKNENNQKRYNLLLILTDGLCDDVEDFLDAIVNSSYYNISIILVNISEYEGKEFINFNIDKYSIVGFNKKKQLRKNTVYVNFNALKKNEKELAYRLLKDIPSQMLEYYKLKGIQPNDGNQEKIAFNNNIINDNNNNIINEYPIDNNEFNNNNNIIVNNNNNVINENNLNEYPEINIINNNINNKDNINVINDLNKKEIENDYPENNLNNNNLNINQFEINNNNNNNNNISINNISINNISYNNNPSKIIKNNNNNNFINNNNIIFNNNNNYNNINNINIINDNNINNFYNNNNNINIKNEEENNEFNLIDDDSAPLPNLNNFQQ